MNLVNRSSARSDSSAEKESAARACNASPNARQDDIAAGAITATVIECPGRWEDSIFEAVQIDVEGVKTPFVMTLALPRVSYHALSEFVNPADLYEVIADAINKAQVSIDVRRVAKANHAGKVEGGEEKKFRRAG